MATTIDEQARELLEGKNFCTVSTLRRDGTVHSAVVWVDIEDDRVLLNSAEGRAWPTNVERDPRVTLAVVDHEMPYRYAEIRGRVVETTTDGADEHIDALAKKYTGSETYQNRQPGEVRVKIAVEPDRVRVAGG